MRRRVKKNRTLFKFASVLIILIISLFFLFLGPKLFSIQKIDIESSGVDCATSEQIISTSDIKGKNIIFIDDKKIEKQIIAKFICIKNINISKSFPSKVKLRINPRTAKAILIPTDIQEASSSAGLESIATPSADLNVQGFVADKEGVVFSKQSIGSLPAIFINNQNLTLGKVLSNDQVNALNILEKISVFGINASTSYISDNFFIIYGLPKVIFRLDNNVNIQIASLQLILEKAKIDSSQVEFIDLRFDKPIIRLAPKKK